MGPALAAAGVDGKANAKAGLAGDGFEAAFQRIRSCQHQAITVAEPLNRQGWQLVSRLKRAMSGEACFCYITAAALMTDAGPAAAGARIACDPQNGDRDAYVKICWKM